MDNDRTDLYAALKSQADVDRAEREQAAERRRQESELRYRLDAEFCKIYVDQGAKSDIDYPTYGGRIAAFCERVKLEGCVALFDVKPTYSDQYAAALYLIQAGLIGGDTAIVDGMTWLRAKRGEDWRDGFNCDLRDFFGALSQPPASDELPNVAPMPAVAINEEAAPDGPLAKLTAEDRAIAILAKDPTIRSIAAVARLANCSRQHLSDCPRFVSVWEEAQKANCRPPKVKGTKAKGHVEAWQDDD